MLLADLDEVDGPCESRLIGIRWVAAGDEHPPGGIHPALAVVVHVLAAHVHPSLGHVPDSQRRDARPLDRHPRQYATRRRVTLGGTYVIPVTTLTYGFVNRRWSGPRLDVTQS